MIDKIYLDLDGCIADFYTRYSELYSSTPKVDDKGKLFGERFDSFIKNKNFETLELLPDAQRLIDHLIKLDIPTEILGSTGRAHRMEEVSRQKDFWLKKYNINFPSNYVPGKHLKYKFATVSSILIDDTESNIIDWHKAGGIGILHKNSIDTILELNTILFYENRNKT